MKLEKTIRTQGNFSALLAEADTGSIIQLGSFPHADWTTGQMGVYIINDEDVSYINDEGSLVKMGVLDPLMTYNSGPRGFYVSLGNEIFQMLNDGTLRSLVTYPSGTWGCGGGGVYLLNKGTVSLITDTGLDHVLEDHDYYDVVVTQCGLIGRRIETKEQFGYYRILSDGSSTKIGSFPQSLSTYHDTPSGFVIEDPVFVFWLIEEGEHVLWKHLRDFDEDPPCATRLGKYENEIATAGLNGVYFSEDDNFSLLVIK